MLSPETVVINTGPLIALCAGLGDLSLLKSLYRQVIVPAEVEHEIQVLRQSQFVQPEFQAAKSWLQVWPHPVKLAPWLQSSIDLGEASVIQLALDEVIPTVIIDEAAGRRIAKLSGLKVTGSIGLLLRAKNEGLIAELRPILASMKTNGVWLSDTVIQHALKLANEASS